MRILISTPGGKLIPLLRASMVLPVGCRISMSRLCVRISNCSRDFLSMCGQRSTVKRSMRVGSGMGVFLTVTPPFRPFASSMAFCEHVQRYIVRAGIKVARPGMHTFRYSCAKRLLEKGESLKTIADYLGHDSVGTTQRY